MKVSVLCFVFTVHRQTTCPLTTTSLEARAVHNVTKLLVHLRARPLALSTRSSPCAPLVVGSTWPNKPNLQFVGQTVLKSRAEGWSLESANKAYTVNLEFEQGKKHVKTIFNV